MTGVAVSHQDYTNKTGERYPTKKPQDSDILHGDGLFTSETQSGSEFTKKTGESFDAVYPQESDLWQVCVSVKTFEFFQHLRNEIQFCFE